MHDLGSDTMRTLYDGLSFEVLRESVTFSDGSFSAQFTDEVLRRSDSFRQTGRYVWIEDAKPNEPYGEYGTKEDVNQMNFARYKGERTPLYARGENVALMRSATERTRGGGAYFGKDILGSVRSATDEYGSLEDRYEYDAFGIPYSGNFYTGLGAGYTGKAYDPVTGLYNYGYRDYSPSIARFTTVDPIRDGANWFSYVNNDPVNWVDEWGLSASDGKAKDCGIYDGEGNYTKKCKDDMSKFIFNNTIFTADNPLSQLELDKALNIKSDSKTTKSCQTTAMINAYAVNNQNGITGKQIINALTNNDGTLKKTLYSDGSPSCMLEDISKDLASSCGSTLFLKPSKEKMSISLLADLSAGAILGYAKTSSKKKTDSHFGYKNQTYTIDSLDPNRLAAKNYEENSYRILQWSSLK